MGRYLRALPLISCLLSTSLLSGCYFDLIGSSDERPASDAKQHVMGFSYNNYDKQKVNDWSISGERSTINQDRSLNLTKPIMQIKNPKNPIEIAGKNGGWNPTTQEVTIADEVVAQSQRMGIFTTKKLIYSSPHKNFRTDETVHFRHNNISIDGRGLFGSTLTEKIDILSDVKVLISIER